GHGPRGAEAVVQLVDLCDLRQSFGPSASKGEKSRAILMRATVARCQGDGTAELAIGSVPIPVKLRTQQAEGVVGFADAVVQCHGLGYLLLCRPVGLIPRQR